MASKAADFICLIPDLLVMTDQICKCVGSFTNVPVELKSYDAPAANTARYYEVPSAHLHHKNSIQNYNQEIWLQKEVVSMGSALGTSYYIISSWLVQKKSKPLKSKKPYHIKFCISGRKTNYDKILVKSSIGITDTQSIIYFLSL